MSKIVNFNDSWEGHTLFEVERVIKTKINNLKPQDMPYTTVHDPNIVTMKEALDKLMCPPIKINSFNIASPAITIYEVGTVINDVSLSWEYDCNIDRIVTQTINGSSVTGTTYSVANANITDNKTYILQATDGKTEASASVAISFVSYVYYGSKMLNTNVAGGGNKLASGNTFSVTPGRNEHVWIFIPHEYRKKIYVGGIDQTGAFSKIEDVYHTNDSGGRVKGTMFVSSNPLTGTKNIELKDV